MEERESIILAYRRDGLSIPVIVRRNGMSRKTFTELVKRIAANISIPFTVGGGIHELGDVDRLLHEMCIRDRYLHFASKQGGNIRYSPCDYYR